MMDIISSSGDGRTQIISRNGRTVDAINMFQQRLIQQFYRFGIKKINGFIAPGIYKYIGSQFRTSCCQSRKIVAFKMFVTWMQGAFGFVNPDFLFFTKVRNNCPLIFTLQPENAC